LSERQHLGCVHRPHHVGNLPTLMQIITPCIKRISAIKT
jgi:hypothetical protein